MLNTNLLAGSVPLPQFLNIFIQHWLESALQTINQTAVHFLLFIVQH